MEDIKFISCSFMEAMDALDKWGRIRFAGLTSGLYFKKVKLDNNTLAIWLCIRKATEEHGIFDIKVRAGMAVMGNEAWEKEA